MDSLSHRSISLQSLQCFHQLKKIRNHFRTCLTLATKYTCHGINHCTFGCSFFILLLFFGEAIFYCKIVMKVESYLCLLCLVCFMKLECQRFPPSPKHSYEKYWGICFRCPRNQHLFCLRKRYAATSCYFLDAYR